MFLGPSAGEHLRYHCHTAIPIVDGLSDTAGHSVTLIVPACDCIANEDESGSIPFVLPLCSLRRLNSVQNNLGSGPWAASQTRTTLHNRKIDEPQVRFQTRAAGVTCLAYTAW